MLKRGLFLAGSVFLVLGVSLFYFSVGGNISGITGNAINLILGDTSNFVGSYIGLVFALFGLILVLISARGGLDSKKRDESILEGEIIRGYRGQPLRWQEEYPKLREEFLEWYKKNHLSNILPGAPEKYLRETASKYFEDVELGNVSRDTNILRYVESKVESEAKSRPYQEFLKKRSFLDNEAARVFFSGKVPDKLRYMIFIAVKCGYRVEPSEGDGNRVYDSSGRIITELGSKRRCENQNIQRGRLSAMASGESSFRKGDNKSLRK